MITVTITLQDGANLLTVLREARWHQDRGITESGWPGAYHVVVSWASSNGVMVNQPTHSEQPPYPLRESGTEPLTVDVWAALAVMGHQGEEEP